MLTVFIIRSCPRFNDPTEQQQYFQAEEARLKEKLKFLDTEIRKQKKEEKEKNKAKDRVGDVVFVNLYITVLCYCS